MLRKISKPAIGEFAPCSQYSEKLRRMNIFYLS